MMYSTHRTKHPQAAHTPLGACDLAIVSMELLALHREEKRKLLSRGKMEKWLEDITARTSSKLELPQGGVFIPNYSRNVTVRFEDPEVRKKLIKLVNTDVVKVMDKDFMGNLQNMLYQSYWTAFEERLAARREWESERRKALALDGIQPLDDNSLDKHPIFEVRNEVEKAFEEMKKKTEKPYQIRRKMTWDYKQFSIKSSESEESVALEESETEKNVPDLLESEKKNKDIDLKMDPSYNTLMSEDFYRRIKYEPPLVKELRAAHTVNDLYDIAEKILDHKQPYKPLTEAMIRTGLKVDEPKPEPEAEMTEPA